MRPFLWMFAGTAIGALVMPFLMAVNFLSRGDGIADPVNQLGGIFFAMLGTVMGAAVGCFLDR